MGLQGLNVLVTGASMGIGMSIAKAVAAEGGNLILFSRTESKLAALKQTIQQDHPKIKVEYQAVDIQNHEQVSSAVKSTVQSFGKIDILINNGGIALGSPLPFHLLTIANIQEMNDTNINGTMFVTHAVLNASMIPHQSGTILTITSSSGIEVPPYPGKTVYHASKVCQEGFCNALRNELSGTDIRVLVLRPGGVDTEFHAKSFGGENSGEKVEKLMDGWTPLQPKEVADTAIYMLNQPLNVSIKALDVYPTAQRSLAIFDRTWNSRRNEADS